MGRSETNEERKKVIILGDEILVSVSVDLIVDGGRENDDTSHPTFVFTVYRRRSLSGVICCPCTK